MPVDDDQLQSTKLEALGRLAGGVAHDFNNLLTVIEGYARMLRDEPDLAQADAVEYIDEIIRASSRASDLTRQLLAFSRRQSSQPRSLDLNDLVRSTSGMLRRVIGEDIQLETDLCAEASQIFADPSQIDQVLMNLWSMRAMRCRVAAGFGSPRRFEIRRWNFASATTAAAFRRK